MCITRLNNFLFPFNFFGKKKKSIAFYIGDIPIVGIGGYGSREINIKWTGKRLVVSHTERFVSEWNAEREYRKIKNTYTDGVVEERNIYLPYHRGMSSLWTYGSYIYFNCTNVTSLVVNGETLI